jgi:Protein of unknown function (DUF3574)
VIRCGALLFTVLALAAPASAATRCPLPGQKPMLLVKMYFGQSLDNGREISQRDWDRFLSNTVTPRFPEGLSVYDARGQWTGPSHKPIGERSKIVEIAAPDTPAVRSRVADIARDYRRRFRQHSVGIVTSASCAAF